MSATDREGLNADPDAYFSEAYQDVMYTGIIGVYSRLVHRLMERPVRGVETPTILEVGAGAGQHAPFVESRFTEYIQTDISPTLVRQATPADPRVVARVADAENLADFDTDSVDRLIATCLLAHLDHPEQALAEWRRVVRPGGTISIYVPSEPGMLLRLLRHGAVAPKSRRHGQDHLAIVYRDHRNHYPGMREHIKAAFRGDDITRRRFPTRWVGWNWSLFEIFHITVR